MANTSMTAYVDFNLIFEDDTTKTLSIGPLKPTATALTSIKSKVKAFEQSFNSDTAKLMISKYGNDWAGFESVKKVVTYKTVLF